MLILDIYFFELDTIKKLRLTAGMTLLRSGENMSKHKISLKLLELRQQHNLTQKQLCERLNISRSVYSYFECDRRTPDVDTLLMFSEYYGISLDELVTGSPVTDKKSAQKPSASDSGTALARHLQSKHIPLERVMQLTKADFDFLSDYKKLSAENQAEMVYLMNYKIRKQTE